MRRLCTSRQCVLAAIASLAGGSVGLAIVGVLEFAADLSQTDNIYATMALWTNNVIWGERQPLPEIRRPFAVTTAHASTEHFGAERAELDIGVGTSTTSTRPAPRIKESRRSARINVSAVGKKNTFAQPPFEANSKTSAADVESVTVAGGRSNTTGLMLLAIYQQLCAWGVIDAGRVRKLSAERRDTLSKMFAPLIEMQPAVPFSGNSRPGGPFPTNPDRSVCQPQYLGTSSVLTGRLRAGGPRMVIDMFTGMGGGAELDLLELRLHELDGVADLVVVTESHYGNRCDRKLLHFDRQKSRFEAFLPKIMHVVTDVCPRYLDQAEKCHAKSSSNRSAQIYFQEQEQRACARQAILDAKPDLPDDALVVLTDLDEIPSGRMLHALKHCEIYPSALVHPLGLQLQPIPFNLRSRCPRSRRLYNKGNIALWRQFKRDKVDIWPTRRQVKVPLGGVHLSAYGSRAQLDYRMLNHGESGQLMPLVLPEGRKLRYCNTTIENVTRLQQQLTDSPLSVLRRWEKHDPNHKMKSVQPADLAPCLLPWPLLACPERYPFFWGKGKLE